MTISVSQASRSACDAVVGLLRAARALELERRRDDADRERAELARDARDDRRGAGAGAAALAGGDEDHVGAAQRALDRVVAVLGRAAADLGIGAGAETLGELAADVDLRRRVAHLQLLDVRVDRDEVDLRDAGVDHPVDRVQAGAADADDADDREVGGGVAGALEPGRLLGKRVEPAGERRAPGASGSGSGSGGAGATARIGVGGRRAPRRRRARRQLRLLPVFRASVFSPAARRQLLLRAAAGWRWAASVARKSSASGPSRMLARFLAIEHLLRQIAVHLGRLPVGLVRETQLPFTGASANRMVLRIRVL